MQLKQLDELIREAQLKNDLGEWRRGRVWTGPIALQRVRVKMCKPLAGPIDLAFARITTDHRGYVTDMTLMLEPNAPEKLLSCGVPGLAADALKPCAPAIATTCSPSDSLGDYDAFSTS